VAELLPLEAELDYFIGVCFILIWDKIVVVTTQVDRSALWLFGHKYKNIQQIINNQLLITNC
jgi:hypothetical protein